MNLDEVLNYRRSVRVYDKEKEIDTEKVKHCLELATLAPNSSDMQLWEFYHITQPSQADARQHLPAFTLHLNGCSVLLWERIRVL